MSDDDRRELGGWRSVTQDIYNMLLNRHFDSNSITYLLLATDVDAVRLLFMKPTSHPLLLNVSRVSPLFIPLPLPALFELLHLAVNGQ